MSKRFSKCIVILVLFTLLCSVLMSCTKKEPVTGTGTSQKSTKAAAKTSQSPGKKSSGNKTSAHNSTTSDEDKKNPDVGSDTDNENEDGIPGDDIGEDSIDLQGRLVTIGVFGENQAALPDSPIESLRMNYKNMLDAEKLYNCDIEFMVEEPGAIRNDRFITSTLAGVHYVDAWISNLPFLLPSVMVKNIIYPVDDYLDFENGSAWDYPNKDDVLYRGKHYGIAFGPPFSSFCVMYNRDLFEKAGLPRSIIGSYWDNSWTWDKMLDYAITTTIDFNGDGVIDQYGIMAQTSAGVHLAMPFVHSNDGEFIRREGDDYVYALNDVSSVRPLNFVSDLFNTYNVVTTDLTKYDKGLAAMNITASNIISRINNEINNGYIPFPRSPGVQQPTPRYPGGAVYCFPVTTPVEVREGVVKAVAMTTAFWDTTRPEYVSYEKYLRDINLPGANNDGRITDEEDIRAFVDCQTKAKMTNFTCFGNFRVVVTQQILNKIIKRGFSVIQAIDTVAPLAQKEIDDSQK